MIPIRPDARCGLWGTSRILLLCAAHCSSAVAAPPRPAWTAALGVDAGRGGGGAADLKFTHLTTNHGLSQGYVVDILQDRRGFMWFATRDGLNRYDGYTFVVYKHDPNDPGSLSSNFLQDLMEDDAGYLWVATSTGVNRFDPRTERCTRYLHDPENRDTLGGASVKSVVQDGHGSIWFGTEDSGLDKLDPRRGTFTHYRDDSDGRFVGRITQVIEDGHGDIWFTGERGLFHVDQQNGRVTRRPPTSNALSADSVYEDAAGDLWLLANSPVAGLVRYDRRAERLTSYPLAQRASGALASTTSGGSLNGILAADAEDGLWVPSSEGLSYFDLRARRFTHKFRHDEVNPHSLDSNAIFSVYRDRGGVLWVGTENAGLNVLDFRQQRFPRYTHRPSDPDTLSPGRVKAIHQDPDGALWVGFYPRALDRLDRKTGRVTHYLPREGDLTLGEGTNVNSIYRDAAGYLWIGGGGSGLVRFDERTGRFKRYRHDRGDPRSLVSNNVYTIYGDRSGQMWLGLEGGISRFDPATDGFVNYPVPDSPAHLASTVWAIHQERSGALWAGTWGGVLIRFDEQARSFVRYAPDSRDPRKLNGGGINTILEDRTGTLWVGAFDGLYRYDRGSGAFARSTEAQGLPSSSIRCIQEDRLGRLWLSTPKGVSRFDPQEQTFRNYDVSDGLQSDEFSTGCFQAPDGEILFGGTNGLNAFVPENVRDDAYEPPVVITNFTILNRPVRIGAGSVLERAIPFVESLTLPHEHNVFSFEFAALSYANAHKNRYRYRLEGFDTAWNEADSRRRLATYTNLDPGEYVFRVQGSNSDGIWNEQGVSLSIVVTPPWWRTTWFAASTAALVLVLLAGAYQLRMRQVRHGERQLRDVIETVPAMVWSAKPDGSVDFANRRWQEFTGRPDQSPGWGWQAVVHPDEWDAYLSKWRASLATGQPFETEVRIRRAADGEYHCFTESAVPLRDEQGNIRKWYGVLADIEDRKRAEYLTEQASEALRTAQAELAHVNRVATMGQLTASIAHEVNQPIAAAVTNAQAGLRWLAAQPPDMEEIRQAFRRIVADGKRAAEVIARIRSLIKKAPVREDRLDINEAVFDIISLTWGEVRKHGATLKTELAEGLPSVTGDRVQLQQVILNLVMNALEAMSGLDAGPRELLIRSEPDAGGGVLISVRDTGPGLGPQSVDQLFEAFYTTKASGLGMGLSICRSIVEAHGGRLCASANEPRGAVFQFTLPAEDFPPASRDA
jgi:PAS domain S-box-containing protein